MFSTRIGGVSGGVFESLNFASGAGSITDSTENVIKNHSLAAGVFGLTEKDICRSYQTHSSNVEIVSAEHKGTGISKEPFLQGVDGLVTAENELILSVRTADCVPILLYDYKNRICAAVHAGWRGTLGGITAVAIEKMRSLGADTEYTLAAIGPCVGPCCYEVGREVYESFLSSDKDFEQCFVKKGDKLSLDLTEANEIILKQNGIKTDNISSAHLCTCCNAGDFFSHRRSGQNRGTMSALIVIKQRTV
ncbi:MAG: peptidoglycan editing factor PgeF [Firmicutes bacterium HGW-Firmicutes-21]|nr:MAG: peptidoglycan editing factor PgeF [Firmicutes bacterium HGW-Firmicutes-21]